MFMFLHAYIYVCMHLNMHMYIRMCVLMYVCVHVCSCIFMFAHMQVWICVQVVRDLKVYVHVCMHLQSMHACMQSEMQVRLYVHLSIQFTVSAIVQFTCMHAIQFVSVGTRVSVFCIYAEWRTKAFPRDFSFRNDRWCGVIPLTLDEFFYVVCWQTVAVWTGEGLLHCVRQASPAFQKYQIRCQTFTSCSRNKCDYGYESRWKEQGDKNIHLTAVQTNTKNIHMGRTQ